MAGPKKPNTKKATKASNIAKARKLKLDKKKWLAIYADFEKTLGVKGTVHKEMGISRCTFKKWIDNDPEFAAAVKAVEEQRLDFFEMAVLDEAFIQRTPKLLEVMTRILLRERGFDPAQKVEVSGSINVIGLDDIRK